MALRYCFEEDYVKSTLARSKPSDLAVIDSDGISKSVIQTHDLQKIISFLAKTTSTGGN